MALEEFAQLTKELSGFCGTLALVGTAKNAGKTTALNYLLRNSSSEATGVTSIGRDGEEIDALDRHPKPAIFVEPGTLFATSAESLRRCLGTWTVVSRTGMNTALGPVSVCRAESPCRVELTGPSRVDELVALAELLCSLGARKVLIDGAFDRVAASAGKLSDAVVLAVGSSGKTTCDEVAEEAAGYVRRFRLSVRAAQLDARTLVFRASFSADEVEQLSGQTVVVPDPSCCLIDPSSWRWLDYYRVQVQVERQIPLLAVFVNPFRPYLRPLPALELLECVRRACPDMPVFDLNLEGEIPR